MSLSASLKKFRDQQTTETHMQQALGANRFNKNKITKITSNSNISYSKQIFSDTQNQIELYHRLKGEIEILQSEIEQLISKI